jgi:hypothetical protein
MGKDLCQKSKYLLSTSPGPRILLSALGTTREDKNTTSDDMEVKLQKYKKFYNEMFKFKIYILKELFRSTSPLIYVFEYL